MYKKFSRTFYKTVCNIQISWYDNKAACIWSKSGLLWTINTILIYIYNYIHKNKNPYWQAQQGGSWDQGSVPIVRLINSTFIFSPPPSSEVGIWTQAGVSRLRVAPLRVPSLTFPRHTLAVLSDKREGHRYLAVVARDGGKSSEHKEEIPADRTGIWLIAPRWLSPAFVCLCVCLCVVLCCCKVRRARPRNLL